MEDGSNKNNLFIDKIINNIIGNLFDKSENDLRSK